MNFFDAARLAGEDGAEVDLLAAETDAPAMGDNDGFVVEGIVDVGQSGIGAGGRLIDFGRALHVQGFMRTFVVEDFDEVVEAGLLLQKVACGRLGDFFLQREMHAFMAAVLLGMAGLDPFNTNPEPKPPDGELAQVKQGVCRSEGNAVIAADVGGQAALLEKPLKHSKSVVFSGGGKRLAGEKKTAGMIGNGERVTVVTISEQELSLVIGAPQLVGPLTQG